MTDWSLVSSGAVVVFDRRWTAQSSVFCEKPLRVPRIACVSRLPLCHALSVSSQTTYSRSSSLLVQSGTVHQHRFVESTPSASYSEWNVDKSWSSQEWKSDG